MTTEKLLREYVREVLAEDDGGAYGDLSMAGAGMSPYGVSFGSGDDLYKIFVKPFVDVVDTAMGKTKELSKKGQTLIHVAFEAVATTLVPVLRDSYGEIFADEKKQIDRIKEEYHDVYQSNWDAFRDNDVFCTAFCYAPAAVLTAKLAQKSPKIVMGLLSVLTGGNLDPWLNKVKNKFEFEGPPKTGLEFTGTSRGSGPVGDYGGGGHHNESLVREDEHGDGNKHKQQQPKPDIASVLTGPKVMAKLQQSSVVKSMEQEGQKLVRNTLQQVFKQASGVLKATTLQDMQHRTGAKIQGLDKLQQVPQQERQKAEQAILVATKKSMKEFFVKNLEAQVKKATAAGIPDNHPYVTDYQSVIAKVKAL